MTRWLKFGTGNILSRSTRLGGGQHVPLQQLEHHNGEVIYAQSDLQPDSDHARAWIYGWITFGSALFMVLNFIQVALIYRLNNYYWTVLVPALLILILIGVLIVQAHKFQLITQWGRATWDIRLPKIGIVATVLLNIIAVEFVYIPLVAIPAARNKVWKTSIAAHTDLLLPVMALSQDSYNYGRAVIAKNSTQLAIVAGQQTVLGVATFTDYTIAPAPQNATLITDSKIQLVFLNSTVRRNLTGADELFTSFYYYQNINEIQAALGLTVFDPRFLAPGLVNDAYNCGIMRARLFSAPIESQIALEQVIINDKVKAIDYSDFSSICDRPEFRHYSTYRQSLVQYGQPYQAPNCRINGTVPPEWDQLWPCQGHIDLTFGSMLVTTLTSDYSRDRVQMLTDEGGIIGGIMFGTWFFSIFSQ